MSKGKGLADVMHYAL